MLLKLSYHRSMGVTARAFGVLTGLLISVPPLHASDYPIVFKSAMALRELGIAVNFGRIGTRPFQNKCYYYGDGGYLISISDEFFARFRSKGFTVQSACLGLISQTRYNPETGERLPTYIIVDHETIARERRQHGEIVSPDATTEELSLALPECFKNGNPYTDCRFLYGRKTGKRLTTAETETYRQLGAALDNGVRALMRSKKSNSDEFFDHREKYIPGYRKTDGHFLEADLPDGTLDEKLKPYSSASIWVRSSRFARGYGYALDADGTATPAVSAAAVKAAIDGPSKSQINVEELRRLLNSNR